MAKVRVLPEVLAHKIAAGEIVERPASVVKELVENSLDAQSKSVTVEIEDGGKRLITVRDDGFGMSREDAQVAFQHHATSKIETFDDLTRIASLGFRGEALPSIASISRLRLKTVERDAQSGLGAGTEVEFEGGKLIAVRDIAWPVGTEFVVEDLFFNVPARRKFLKTTATEAGHVSRQLTHYALAYPEVEFQLRHQNRPLLEAPAVQSLEDRVYQVLGDEFLENLAPIEYERDGVRVGGFASLPHEQRGSNRDQYLFVNRRVVRDKVVTHALRQAYQDLIPAQAYPVALLFVEIDPSEVDVNVHPSKIEIRFHRSDRVHRAIYHAVEEALLRRRTSLSSLARDVPAWQMRPQALPDHQASVARSVEKFFQRTPDSSMGFPAFRKSGPDEASWVGPGEATAPVFPPTFSGRPSSIVAATDPHHDDIPETAYLSPVPVVLGQFVESFVVAADREGVMLIDQHVAHERILYDLSLRHMTAGRVPIQRLLIPLTVELTPEQKTALEEILDQLNENGFEVDWFGDRTIVIKGVPEVAARCSQVPQLIEEILDGQMEGADQQNGAGVRRLREKIAISLSCRSAIKINTPLTGEKMQWLIDELFRCENPYTCPHGRPIILRMNIEDVLRGFKRI